MVVNPVLHFPVYRWLDERYADRKTEITLVRGQDKAEYDYRLMERISVKSPMKIEVITTTGWAFADAGTNASIRFVLCAGPEGTEVVLDTFLEIAENNAQPFEVGSVDVFKFYLDALPKGELHSFQISVDDETSDLGWLLETLFLRVNNGEQEYKVAIYRWLDSEAKEGNKINVSLQSFEQEYPAEESLTYEQLYPPLPNFRFLEEGHTPPLVSYTFIIHTLNRSSAKDTPSRLFAEIIGEMPPYGPESQRRYEASGPMELIAQVDQNVLSTQSISELTVSGRDVDKPARLRLSIRACTKAANDKTSKESWTIGNVICRIDNGQSLLFRYNQTIDPCVIRFIDALAQINS